MILVMHELSLKVRGAHRHWDFLGASSKLHLPHDVSLTGSRFVMIL